MYREMQTGPRPTGLRAFNGDATEVERSEIVIHPDFLLNPLWKVIAIGGQFYSDKWREIWIWKLELYIIWTGNL